MPDITYISCPYSSPDPAIRRERWEAVNRLAGRLMSQGEIVFSPISATHPIAEQCGLSLDWEYWKRFDRAYLECCSRLLVLRLPGIESSVGVHSEIEIAQELGIPIEFIDPE